MDVVTIENCILKKSKIVMKLAEEGIAIKSVTSGITTIEKNAIKEIELFRGANGINLRIFADVIYLISGISENFIDDIIKVCNDCYKINLYMKELEITNVTSGDIDVSKKGFIEFRSEKTILDIPIFEIEGIADIRNELSIRLDKTEIRFVTNKEVISEVKDACNSNIEDDIITFENVTMLYPRGKNNFKMYKDYFRIIGYSYDHKIWYRNIKSIFYLDKMRIDENEKYVLLSLDNPIRQGLTKYPLLVLSFGNETEHFEIEDKRLNPVYDGYLFDIFTDIFQRMCNTKITTSNFVTSDNTRGLKCTYKAYEGQLYPLDGCLIFLPRSIKINIKDIHSVEFSRINVSSLQAKTFDMTICAEPNYTFNGLYKEDFGYLEKYFADSNISIRSEIIDEVISSDDTEEYSDDDFVVSDEEE